MRLKNTGVEPKLGLSAVMPVEIACPVFGHLIITSPTVISLIVHVLLSVEMPHFTGTRRYLATGGGFYLVFARVCDMPAAIGFAASAATLQYSAHNSLVRLDIALSCRGAWVLQTSNTSGKDFAAIRSRQQS